MDNQYVIEPLERRHDRAAFTCGVEALDGYLKRQASQDMRRHVAAVHVACLVNTVQVVGYYTLSMSAVEPAGLPEAFARRLPAYPILPVALLGRLAVDQRLQGRGLGGDLLISALRKCYLRRADVASLGVVVDAKGDPARRFYEAHGFQRITEDAYRLFLPMGTIAALFPGE